MCVCVSNYVDERRETWDYSLNARRVYSHSWNTQSLTQNTVWRTCITPRIFPYLPPSPPGTSLTVGTDDACASLHGDGNDTERAVAASLGKIAVSLGLAPHDIIDRGSKTGKATTVPFGCDVEGHIDDDGFVRVLDTARVFPPEHPEEVPHLPGVATGVSIYWRLLRPEFVRSYTLLHGGGGLSSDTCSGFSRGAKDAAGHEHNLRNATKFLVERSIAKAAHHIYKLSRKELQDGKIVTDVLHRAGVNARHLGKVWYEIKGGTKCTMKLRARNHHVSKHITPHEAGRLEACLANPGPTSDGHPRQRRTFACPDRHTKARFAVGQEMIGRTVKNLLRRALRDMLLMGGSTYELRRVVAETFSRVMWAVPGSEAFWHDVQDGVRHRFGPLAFAEKDEAGNLTRMTMMEHVVRFIPLLLLTFVLHIAYFTSRHLFSTRCIACCIFLFSARTPHTARTHTAM